MGFTINKGVYIRDNDLLENLSGIKISSTFLWLEILRNNSLVDLSGISGINEIDYLYVGGNEALESLDGLDDLIVNRGLYIGWYIQTDINAPLGNPNLRDFCALQNLFLNGTFIPFGGPFDGVYINNNLFNPTYASIAAGNCSF